MLTFLIYLSAIYISSFVGYLCKFLANFSTCVFVFFLLVFRGSLCVKEIAPSLLHMFLKLVICLLIFLFLKNPQITFFSSNEPCQSTLKVYFTVFWLRSFFLYFEFR